MASLCCLMKGRNEKMTDAEKINLLQDALRHVRSIIVDGAMTGFNWKDGDWTERLFASQQITKDALDRSSS